MFISSKTCRFAIVLAAASCNAATAMLRGNSQTTTAATPVESLADAHSRMLAPLDFFYGDEAARNNLAVISGASMIFTHPATKIVDGDVCADSSFTGLPSEGGPDSRDLDYNLIEGNEAYSGTAYRGGCGPTYLVDLLTDAMDKSAEPISVEMGGLTFSAGTYFSTALTVADNSVVTLDGTATDFFLFQSGSYLVTGANTKILLTGGVEAKNVLFATTGAATTGAAGSTLEGSILAGAAVTLGEGSDVSGYVLATAAMTVGTGCTLNSASLTGTSTESPIRNVITEAAGCTASLCT
jgi:hypothetical protein